MTPRLASFPLALVVAGLTAACSGGSGGSTTPPTSTPPPALPDHRQPVEVTPAGPADPIALAPEVTVDLVNTYIDPESGLVNGNAAGTASVQLRLMQVPGSTTSAGVEFSTNGGTSFQTATLDEDTSQLTQPASPGGLASPQAEPVLATYDVTWQIASDLGPGHFFAASEDPDFGAIEVRATIGDDAHGPLANDPVEIDLGGFPFGSQTSAITARQNNAAFVFPGDQLFLAGGEGAQGVTPSAELGMRGADAEAFANFLFTETAALPVARRNMAQALGPDKKLWLTGGEDALAPRHEVDVFDPQTQTFASLPPLVYARAGHAMQFLPNGLAIVIGGRSDAAGGPPAGNTCEIFDPLAGTWVVSTLSGTYSAPLAVCLEDGRILVTGPAPGTDTRQAEYLTLTGDSEVSSSPAVLPLASRRGATANILLTGEVLLFGGHDLAGQASLPEAELLNPAAGFIGSTVAVEIANPLVPGYAAASRWGHASALTGAGRVLFFGGRDATETALDRVDSFLPKSAAFWPSSSLPAARAHARVNRLTNGDLVVSSGSAPTGAPMGTTATLTSPDGVDHLPSASATQLTWSPPLGLVTIDYTLFDAESNDARVHIEWTTRPQEPASWRPATAKTLFGVPFGDGYHALATSPDGVNHTFGWDANADNIFGQGSPADIFVRVTPIGAEEGPTDEFSQVLP